MVQILPRRPGVLERFGETFQPAFQKGLERFFEEEKEERNRSAKQRAAKALGLSEDITEPSVQAALIKEREKDRRNKEMLSALGIIPQGLEAFVGDEAELTSPQQEAGGLQPEQFTDEQIAGLALINPQIASTIQRAKESAIKQRTGEEKEKRRQFEAERAYHTDLTKKTREKISGLQEALPKKESALNLAREALQTEDLGFFSRDKLADLTGVGAFRTAKGAQLITAGKENLLSNISRVTARAANQWFEQRLNSMFPQIGQSQEANETILSMLEGELALDQAYLDEFQKEATQDREQYGYIREDIEDRVRKNLKPLEDKILQRTSYQLRQIYEREKGPKFIEKNLNKKVSKGTPLTLQTAKLLRKKYGDEAEKKARQLGYTIPAEEIFMEFIE